jgi:hypothetical protein
MNFELPIKMPYIALIALFNSDSVLVKEKCKTRNGRKRKLTTQDTAGWLALLLFVFKRSQV